jgi:hypothetical protein
MRAQVWGIDSRADLSLTIHWGAIFQGVQPANKKLVRNCSIGVELFLSVRAVWGRCNTTFWDRKNGLCYPTVGFELLYLPLKLARSCRMIRLTWFITSRGWSLTRGLMTHHCQVGGTVKWSAWQKTRRSCASAVRPVKTGRVRSRKSFVRWLSNWWSASQRNQGS